MANQNGLKRPVGRKRIFVWKTPEPELTQNSELCRSINNFDFKKPQKAISISVNIQYETLCYILKRIKVKRD